MKQGGYRRSHCTAVPRKFAAFDRSKLPVFAMYRYGRAFESTTNAFG